MLLHIYDVTPSGEIEHWGAHCASDNRNGVVEDTCTTMSQVQENIISNFKFYTQIINSMKG